MEKLRAVLLDCGLTEELKWGVPCYTFRKKNVVIVSALKECCTLGFFKGALLGDPHGILTKPGENTQTGRVIRFDNAGEAAGMEPVLKDLIHEAIEVEKAGLKAGPKKEPDPVPEELQKKFDEMPALKTAFFALTPGRQRGYILHFSAPRQSKTRIARIEKCTQSILGGIGLHDQYAMKKKN